MLDHADTDQMPSASTVIASDRADKTVMDASVNQMHGMAESSSTAGKEPADTVRVVTVAMHTAGRTGSQPTQRTGPSQPPVQPATQTCRTGVFSPSHENFAISAYSVSS